MRATRGAAGGALALAALLIAGAAALKLYERGRPLPTQGVAWLMTTDWVHVPAHLLLYGALGVCCLRAFGGRRLPAMLAVAAVALAQEGCQSILVGRAPGWPEAFDLAVDGAALAGALRLYRGWGRAWRGGVCYNRREPAHQNEARACRPPTPPQPKARHPPARD